MTSNFGNLANVAQVIVAVVILQATNGEAELTSTPYDVEGCYSEFKLLVTKDMGHENSNFACQKVCRDQGFALAATHDGTSCQCGDIYPTGKEVSDAKCNSPCVTYQDCNSAQECCGGVDSYTVSMVGDIDTTKQVLRRISNEWLNNDGYRTSLMDFLEENCPNEYVTPARSLVDWNTAPNDFNRAGLAACGENEFITGLDRSTDPGDQHTTYFGGLHRIERAQCSLSMELTTPETECYDQDWNLESPYDMNTDPSWGACKDGYYLSGLYRSDCDNLHCIEWARCCKPHNSAWGECKVKDVWDELDNSGTTSCDDNYFLIGLWRDCDYVGCIEKFHCCKMDLTTSTNAWKDDPNFNILTVATDGTLQNCSMRAKDTSASSDSYECQSAANADNKLFLDAKKFEILNQTPLNVAQPEPIPGVDPVTCAVYADINSTCTKTFDTTITTSSTFTIGAGFESSVSISNSVEVDAGFMGSGMKTTFQAQVSASTSFNCERSSTTETSTTDSTSVTVSVPEGAKVEIDMKRSTQNLQYKWKGYFEAVGPYYARWLNGCEYLQDISTVLTGDDLLIYAFGSWEYPGTDTLNVIVTDQYGEVSSCVNAVNHINDTTNSCNANANACSKSEETKEEL